MRRLALCTVLTLAVATPAASPQGTTAAATQDAPVAVGVWYRGTPAGTPTPEDLAVIRALGFTSVTWAASPVRDDDPIRKMAATVGLRLYVAERATTPPVGPVRFGAVPHVDLVVTPQRTGALTALAWRAIARGVRSIAFDAGSPTGAGLENRDRSLKPWVKPAIDLARQFSANRRLITALRPGPGVVIAPETPGFEVVMLDADRSWVLIATNTSAKPVEAMVRLPAGAPYAIWLNMLDARTLAMNGEAAGPKWTARLDAGAAQVFVIDKIMK
jgi:hypothetical protein